MDKIFVGEFVKEVEIGAFQSEHGSTQRVKFNVSLEIEPTRSQLNDNVDHVLSYEIITDAINLELASQRFNLLETLAEKVAERCLREDRVTRAEVKIEKLDRIVGSLGVHISRIKVPQKKMWNINTEGYVTSEIALASFPSSMSNTEEMKSWLTAFLASKKKVTILLGPSFSELPMVSFKKTMSNSVISQLTLLGMEQEAWRISCFDRELAIVSTKSELHETIQANNVTLFCPSHFVRTSLSSVPDLLSSYNEFLVWLAEELGIKNLYLVGQNETKLKNNFKKLNVSFFDTHDWTSFK